MSLWDEEHKHVEELWANGKISSKEATEHHQKIADAEQASIVAYDDDANVEMGLPEGVDWGNK